MAAKEKQDEDCIDNNKLKELFIDDMKKAIILTKINFKADDILDAVNNLQQSINNLNIKLDEYNSNKNNVGFRKLIKRWFG